MHFEPHCCACGGHGHQLLPEKRAVPRSGVAWCRSVRVSQLASFLPLQGFNPPGHFTPLPCQPGGLIHGGQGRRCYAQPSTSCFPSRAAPCPAAGQRCLSSALQPGCSQRDPLERPFPRARFTRGMQLGDSVATLCLQTRCVSRRRLPPQARPRVRGDAVSAPGNGRPLLASCSA